MMEALEFPGRPPFTRGIYPSMYAGRLWTMRQYAGYATAEETNRRYRYLLSQGQAGLSVAFDLPTQMGYDPTDSMAKGEVGKAGVSIAVLEDMEALFEGIPQDRVTVSMTINATASILLALYAVAAERRGVSTQRLSGTVQNDILKEFIARGCYIFPPRPSLKLVVDVIEYCVRHFPRWNFISVSGYHIREAGSTAAQELGFTLANGIAYLEACLNRGLDVHAVGQRLSFFLNAHSNWFEEIAKYRAARRLWARIMKERFKATDERAMMLRFHTQTAGSTLTAQQPENNVVRVALQALSAVLGGTNSLHTNARDEALALPSEEAATLALRTQQIVAEEMGIADVIDPFGGSVYLEQETDRLEEEARRYIRVIDGLGGAVAAVEQRYYQREIEKSAIAYQRQVERGDRIVVGVNRYQEERESEIKTLKVDESVPEARAKRLREILANRDRQRAETALYSLEEAVDKDRNLMPALIDCIRAHVTLGEICHTLRRHWGVYRPGDS